MVDIMSPEGLPEDDVPLLDDDTAGAPRSEADSLVAVIPEGEGEDEDALPPHAEPLSDGRVRLPMMHPKKAVISFRKGREGEVQKEEYPALVFRRLHGADMRAIAAAGKGADPAVVAIARATGIHVPKMHLLYDAMDAADVSAASQVVAHFLGNGPKTGR